jgi:hypothetical protein
VPRNRHDSTGSAASMRFGVTIPNNWRFEDGTTRAVVRSPQASEAIDWLARAGGFTGTPTARAWTQTL